MLDSACSVRAKTRLSWLRTDAGSVKKGGHSSVQQLVQLQIAQ